jgi:hypothetical protein
MGGCYAEVSLRFSMTGGASYANIVRGGACYAGGEQGWTEPWGGGPRRPEEGEWIQGETTAGTGCDIQHELGLDGNLDLSFHPDGIGDFFDTCVDDSAGLPFFPDPLMSEGGNSMVPPPPPAEEMGTQENARKNDVIVFRDQGVVAYFCSNNRSMRSKQPAFFTKNNREIISFLDDVMKGQEFDGRLSGEDYVAIDFSRCMGIVGPIFARMHEKLLLDKDGARLCARLVSFLKQARDRKIQYSEAKMEQLECLRACDMDFFTYLCFFLGLSCSWRIDTREEGDHYQRFILPCLQDLTDTVQATVDARSVMMLGSWHMVNAFQTCCVSREGIASLWSSVHSAEERTMAFLRTLSPCRIYRGTGIKADKHLTEYRGMVQRAVWTTVNGLMGVFYKRMEDACGKILISYTGKKRMSDDGMHSCLRLSDYLCLLPFTEYIPAGYYFFTTTEENAFFVQGISAITTFHFNDQKDQKPQVEIFLYVKNCKNPGSPWVMPLRILLTKPMCAWVIDWRGFQQEIFSAVKERRCIIMRKGKTDINFVPEEHFVRDGKIPHKVEFYRVSSQFQTVEGCMSVIGDLKLLVGKPDSMPFSIRDEADRPALAAYGSHADAVFSIVREAVRFEKLGKLRILPEETLHDNFIFSTQSKSISALARKPSSTVIVNHDNLISILRLSLALCDRGHLGRCVYECVRGVFERFYSSVEFGDGSCIRLEFDEEKVHEFAILCLGAGGPSKETCRGTATENRKRKGMESDTPPPKKLATEAPEKHAPVVVPEVEPTLAEPTLVEPTLAEHTLAEHTLVEPTLAEHTLVEHTLVEHTLDKDDIVPIDLVDLAYLPQEETTDETEEKGSDELVPRDSTEEMMTKSEMLLKSADQIMQEETSKGNASKASEEKKPTLKKKKKNLKDDSQIENDPRIEKHAAMINDFLDKLKVDDRLLKRILCMCQTDMVFMGSDLDYWSLRGKKLEQGDPLNLQDIIVCFVQSYTMKINKMKIGTDFRERMKSFSRDAMNNNLKFMKDSFDGTIGICDYMLNIARKNMKFMIVL